MFDSSKVQWLSKWQTGKKYGWVVNNAGCRPEVGRREFPDGALVKNMPANAGGARDAGLIPGLGRSAGVGNGSPLQYSCQENPKDREYFWAIVNGVCKQSDMTKHTLRVGIHPRDGKGMISRPCRALLAL